MEQVIKDQVAEALRTWLDETNPERSGKKLADKAGVNMAYVSAIRNGKHDVSGTVIKDTYYYKIGEAIGFQFAESGLHFETEEFLKLQNVLKWAQAGNRIVALDSEDSGQGKTYGLEYYKNNTDKVAYAKATGSMTTKDLQEEILTRLQVKDIPKSARAKMNLIRDKVTESDGWLLILDELDDAKTAQWKLVKEIIDFTKGKCSVVVSGMGIIAKINKLADKRKEGFPQLRRRLLANKIKLSYLNRSAQETLLVAHKITDKSAIKWFADNVHDMQMLAEYIKDALDTAKKQGATINKEFLDMIFKSF